RQFRPGWSSGSRGFKAQCAAAPGAGHADGVTIEAHGPSEGRWWEDRLDDDRRIVLTQPVSDRRLSLREAPRGIVGPSCSSRHVCVLELNPCPFPAATSSNGLPP